jgi:hypothetical protein
MRKGNMDVVAIDLEIYLVIGTVSDFEVRHRPDDVERNETEPAIRPGRRLRPSPGVERILAKRACVSKAKRSA